MIKNKNDVIILAAGNSQRFRDKQKKQNKKISNQSLVDIAIRYFINRKEINNIFVTYNKKIPLNTKYKNGIIFVEGGRTRSHSVYNVVNHINAYTQGYGFVTGPINYIESHDENRLIYQSTEFQNHSLIDAYKRSMLGASILFTSHGVPMIYNGQEFAQNAPGRDSFGYPIPQPLQWDNLDDENIINLNNHYKNLITLRSNYDVLKEPPLEVKYANNNNHVLAYWRVDSDEEIIVIINFDTVSHTIDIEFPHSGIWHEYLSDTQIDINSNWFGGYTLEPLSSYIFTSSISNECNLGDINEDSIVNVIDIVSLVNHILNDTEINFCSGDLNGDGIINVIDIISLVNIIMS